MEIPKVMSEEEKAPEEGEVQICHDSTPKRTKQQKRRSKNIRNAAKLIGKAAVAAKKMKSPRRKKAQDMNTGESPSRVIVPALVHTHPSVAAQRYTPTPTTTVVLQRPPSDMHATPNSPTLAQRRVLGLHA